MRCADSLMKVNLFRSFVLENGVTWIDLIDVVATEVRELEMDDETWACNARTEHVEDVERQKICLIALSERLHDIAADLEARAAALSAPS